MPRDSFDLFDPPTRVGGTAINRYSVANSYGSIGGGNEPDFDSGDFGAHMYDMCLHQGEIWAIHCDIANIDDTLGFSSSRGPFVERFDGASWSHTGGEIESLVAIIPTSEPGTGTRYPTRCRIASDGTDVYIAYVIRQYYNPPGSNNAYEARDVVIRKWNGSSWTELLRVPGQVTTGSGFGDGSFSQEIFLDASPLDSGRCHAAWSDANYLFYANSDMSSPNILLTTTTVNPFFAVFPPKNATMRVGSNGRPYLFCTVDFYDPYSDASNHYFGGRMIDCLTGVTAQFFSAAIVTAPPRGLGGSSAAWGFVRQGDAFPGNHPDYDSLWALGIGGVLWRDTDPNAAAGMASTRAAGFRAGIWTVAANDQTAASFASQASALVGAFNPDLLVLDCEFVAKGYAPDDPSFDPAYPTGWQWSEDMMSALRALQPVQPLGVTMLPVQANHADFNFAAYTSRRCSIWPQAYDGDVNPIDPVGMFQSTVANGVDPDLIVVVLGAPDYAGEVDAMIEAGYITWAVFTLDDLPGTPTTLPPPPTDPNENPELALFGNLANASPIVHREGRDLIYCLTGYQSDGEARVVQVPADGSGPFEPMDGNIRYSTPFQASENFGQPNHDATQTGTGYGSFGHDPVSENLYFTEVMQGGFPARTHMFQRQCPIHSWVGISNIALPGDGPGGYNAFPPFADANVAVGLGTFSASAANRARMFIVDDVVYVMVNYTAQGLASYTGIDYDNPNDYRASQFIVYQQNICRECVACSTAVTGATGAPYLDIEFRGEDSNADPVSADNTSEDADLSGIRFRAE